VDEPFVDYGEWSSVGIVKAIFTASLQFLPECESRDLVSKCNMMLFLLFTAVSVALRESCADRADQHALITPR